MLIAGPNDVAGALAYIVYKRSKIEWRAQFYAAHLRQPDLAEEEAFVQVQMLPESVASLRQRGKRLAAHFVQEALAEKMAAIAIEISQSELAAKFAVLDASVQSSLQQIQTRLDEKRTLGAWCKDIGTTLVASLALVAIVGSILTGYVGLSKLTATTERAVGIEVNPRNKPALGEPSHIPAIP